MDPNHHNEDDTLSAARRRPVGNDPLGEIPPGVFPGRRPLSGPRVALEPVDPRVHCTDLYAIGHQDDKARLLWTYLPYGPFADEKAMYEWLRGSAGSSETVFLAIRRIRDNHLLGMASFLEIRPAVGVIEIGHIWFAPPYQGTADVTEALFLMMRHAMDDLANRRLEWKCNALNLPSRTAALRLGFRFEGVFYNHLTPKGNNRDTAWYSILDSEWPAVRDNFDRWLAPENFDASGTQRLSLSELNRALW